MSLTRRSALHLLGVAALPSLARAAGAPEAWALAAHARAARTPPELFGADERALVSAIADALLPRTDTPGALDVGVPGFVEVLTADWMTDAERSEFREGLAAIELHAIETAGRAWPALDGGRRAVEIAWLEQVGDPGLPARRAYRRLRGFVLHGYLTSERVQREVLKVDITPGRYFGCTPIPSPFPPDGRDD